MARKSDKTIKLCVICGDKAKGINFNALTCMSCKAFFRRNALRNKELKCPFNDSCQVDKITRKFCSRCRLQKCFDLGMKKEWILSDEEKRLIKEKILRNRLRRQQQEMKQQQQQQTGTTSRQRSKSYDSRTSSTGSSSSEQTPTSANGYSSGSFGNRRRHQNYKTAMTVGRSTGQGFHQNDNLSSTTSSSSAGNGQANCPNLTPLGSSYSRYFSNAVSGANGNGNSGLKSPTFSACDLFAEPSAFSLDILLTSDDWDQFSTSSSLNSFYSDCATTGNLHEIGNNGGIGFLSKSSSSSLLTEDSLIFDIQSNGTGTNYRHPCSALIDPKKDDFLYSTALSPYNPDLVQQHQHQHQHQQQQQQQHQKSQQQCHHSHFIGSQQQQQNLQTLLLSSGGGGTINTAIDLFDPSTAETSDDNLDTLSQHLSSDSGSDLYDDPLVSLNVGGRNFKLENNNNNNDPCCNLVKILNNQPNSAGSYHSGTKSAFTALTSSPGSARDSMRDANNNNNNNGNRLFTKSLPNQKFDFSQYLLHDSDPFTFTGQQQQQQHQQQQQQQQDYFMSGSKTSSSLVPVSASQPQQAQQAQSSGASPSNQTTGYSFQHCGDYCYMIPYDNLLSIEQQQQQQQQQNSNEDKSNGTGLGYLGQYLLKAEVGSFEEVISNFDPMIEMVPRLQMSMHNSELASFSKRELIQPERCLIKELTDACSILKNPYKRIIYIASEMSHNCSITEFSIHRLIRMSKRLSAFNRLVKPDQVELLKNGLIEMLGLRSVLMHDPDREAWNFLDDKCKITIVVNMQVIKSACVKNSFQQHRQYPKNFLSEWKSDNIIFDLMTAIVLFTPAAGLKEIDKVKEENLRYTYLLRRYLEIKYPTITEAKSTFNRLMSLLDENRTLSEDIVRFFISTNKSPIHASPLFAQILNCGKHARCHTSTSQTVSADSGAVPAAASADSTISQAQMSIDSSSNHTIQQEKSSYLSSAPSMGNTSLTINTIDDDLLLKQMSSPTSSASTRSCSSPLLPMSPGLGLFENCGAGVVNNNNCGPMSGFNNITSI